MEGSHALAGPAAVQLKTMDEQAQQEIADVCGEGASGTEATEEPEGLEDDEASATEAGEDSDEECPLRPVLCRVPRSHNFWDFCDLEALGEPPQE
mmetsp:Transcript_21690/g.65212  ORF Transcript_21690/g.65212 Transcript_21690/m.65212 type:complete len:95 (+) Transcript_21690:73-357(+)